MVRVEPRTSVLRRSADDTDPVERVIVANADQLVIVTALADPPPRPRLIDRFLRDPNWDALSAEEADMLKAVCALFFIEVR